MFIIQIARFALKMNRFTPFKEKCHWSLTHFIFDVNVNIYMVYYIIQYFKLSTLMR